MHVEVIRTRTSLSIRWTSGDDLWTVAKRFNLGDRILESAEIECSAEVGAEIDQAHAVIIAERMDAVFVRPEDFERAKVSYDHTDDGSPVWIGDEIDGRIWIVKAPKPEAIAGLISVGVKLTCDQLTDQELAALNLAVNFPGFNPRNLPFYSKVSSLFTLDDGNAAHEEAKAALASIVLRRLSPETEEYSIMDSGGMGRPERSAS